MELGRIALDRPEVVVDADRKLDRFGEGVAGDGGDLAHQAAELDWDPLALGAAGEGQELADQIGAAARVRLQDREHPLALLRPVAAQQLDRQQDRRQHVVEVVGDAAGQRADALEPLGPQELGLQALALGDVDADVEHAGLAGHLHHHRRDQQVVGLAVTTPGADLHAADRAILLEPAEHLAGVSRVPQPEGGAVLTDQLVAPEAGHLAQHLVDLEDRAVGEGGDHRRVRVRDERLGESFLGALEDLPGAALLGDVLDHAQDAALALDLDDLGRDLAEDVPAGAGEQPGRQVPDRPLVAQPAGEGLPVGDVGPDAEIECRPTERLVATVAREELEAVVDLDEAALAESRDHQRVRARAEGDRVLLLGGPAGGLLAPAHGDVEQGAFQVDQLAVDVADPLAELLDPAVGAVRVAQAVLQAERPLLGDRLVDRAADRRGVLRVMELGECQLAPQEVVGGVAGQGLDGTVEIELRVALVVARQVDCRGQVLGEGLEQLRAGVGSTGGSLSHRT